MSTAILNTIAAMKGQLADFSAQEEGNEEGEDNGDNGDRGEDSEEGSY